MRAPAVKILLCSLAMLMVIGFAAMPASATPAAFTTFDTTQGGCLDGKHPNGIDCNNYRAKEDVYINGGPSGLGGLADGSYYFVVLVPGFQNGGFIDGASGNLSDVTKSNDSKSDPLELGAGSGDDVSNRTFTVGGGLVTYSGTHALGTDPQPHSVIQLFPYDDTTNMGGVYILGICAVGAQSPSDCKFDAFKVQKQECTGSSCGEAGPATLTVCKFWDQNADHSWDNNEPFIGAWPITATNVDAPTTLDTDNAVVDGVPGQNFGCATFSHSFTDTNPVTVTLTEGSGPDGSASPVSQSCDIAGLTCQPTLTGTWTQTAPWDFTNKVLSTNQVTLNPGDNITADNFGNTIGQPLTTSKDATGKYNTTYLWFITKGVTKCVTSSGVACDTNGEAHQVGGTATFTYQVQVTHDAGTNSGIKVTGTITVNNPNLNASNAVVPVSITGVTDQLSDGTACTVTGGGAQSLTKAATTFAYECDISGTVVPTADTNTVTVSWGAQTLNDGANLAAGSATFTTGTISFAQTLVDDSVTVTDAVTGANCTATLGTVNVNGTTTVGAGGCSIGNLSSPSYGTFTYTRTITVPSFACTEYDNTATFTTDTTKTTGTAGASVTVCGPARTGALTMGFWQNKNGQGIITGQAKTGVCASGTWLRQFAPFQDLSSTATCAQVATYVYNVIKAATCGGSTCNAMLKPQMLSTALDVYFSDPTLGGNKIGAPHPIGGVTIDLTKVCNMIDGSGGTASCSGAFNNVTAVFDNLVCPYTTVFNLLVSSASHSNVGGITWYANAKATQVLAKNTFDAINNQVAFSCP